jgi:hypothetical protein
MRRHRRWLTITSGLVVLVGIGLSGVQADHPKLTAEDVIRLWEPSLPGTEDFQQFVASPKDSTGLMASTFRVVGPSFEDMWNHYADLCGIRDRYKAKALLISGGAGTKGSYIVSDRASLDANGRRVLSVFLLRTDRYTVTATIQPSPDGKAVCGSIAAVTP